MKTVLVVDDESDFRTLVKRYMAPKGWRVLEAKSMKEALELSKCCDVMVIDYALGQEDGETLLQELKAQNNVVPIIVVSGLMPTKATIARLYDLGIVQYVDKPVRMCNLYATIDRAVHLVDMVDQIDAHSIKLLHLVGASV